MSKLMRVGFSDLYSDGREIEVCNIHVSTNLDAKYSGWTFPNKFYAIPEIGDYIESTERPLKVCARTFGLNGSIKIEVTGTPRY